MNKLIIKFKKKGKQVVVFPLSEKSWIDIDQLTEYKQHFDKFTF